MGGDDYIEGADSTPGGSFGVDTIFAGFGDDIIMTFGGDDYIVPGPGADVTRSGAGDDIIVVYNICELGIFEIIDGGEGHDIVYLPISQESAEDNFGVIFIGIEDVLAVTLMIGAVYVTSHFLVGERPIIAAVIRLIAVVGVGTDGHFSTSLRTPHFSSGVPAGELAPWLNE